MGLFDIFKKNKKVEETIDQTMTLETPVFDTPVVEPHVEESSSTESVLDGSGITLNATNDIPTSAPVENKIEPAPLGVEPLPENVPPSPVTPEPAEPVVEPAPVAFEPTEPVVEPTQNNEGIAPELSSEPIPLNEEPIHEEAPAPTVIEPVSAETVVPTSEEVSEIPVTQIENPTASVASEPTVSSDDEEVKFCPNCGNMETDGAIICSNCGSRL